MPDYPDNVMNISTKLDGQIWFCVQCKTHLIEPSCPKCNHQELPPLSVSVTDVAGVLGKVGK